MGQPPPPHLFTLSLERKALVLSMIPHKLPYSRYSERRNRNEHHWRCCICLYEARSQRWNPKRDPTPCSVSRTLRCPSSIENTGCCSSVITMCIVSLIDAHQVLHRTSLPNMVRDYTGPFACGSGPTTSPSHKRSASRILASSSRHFPS